MTSAGQVARLLAMVPYLLAHDGVGLAQVAEEFGVTPEQVRADLAIALMCGLPGLLPGDLIEIDMDAVDGEGVIHLSNADYLSRPLRFSRDEATTMILGLRSLRAAAGPSQRPVIDAAIDKLRAAAGDLAADTDRVQVVPPEADEAVGGAVEAAIARGRRLRLDYDAAGAGQTSRREVEPRAVVLREGYAYLEAWDVDRAGWRSFRVDRIVTAEVAEASADADRGDPPGEADWPARLAGSPVAALTVTAAASWIAEYYPVDAATPVGDGRTRVELRVADARWWRGLLLRLGEGIVAVDPPTLAADAATEAAAALRQYGAWG